MPSTNLTRPRLLLGSVRLHFLTCIHVLLAAIGSLRGPLHGGANEAAMDMIEQWTTPDEAESAIMGMLARKDKIMGFGHAIYRESDPRNVIIKGWSEKLAESLVIHIYTQCLCVVKKLCGDEKKLFCNADFFHASTYNFMGIPTKLFTPIFVMSGLLAGQLMSWSSVLIIGLFAQVQTTQALKLPSG